MAGESEEAGLKVRQRRQKVQKIFLQFDRNGDSRLNRDEMASLVIAVNPRVKFSEEQISAILDEVFRTYGEYIEGDRGLSLDGLVRTYDDGAGDVDRDFDALGLELDPDGGDERSGDGDGENVDRRGEASGSTSGPKASTLMNEEKVVRRKENLGAWASSPNNGIVFDETWRLIEDLELFLRRVDIKIEGKKKEREEKKGNAVATGDDGDWSRELGSAVDREDQVALSGRKGEDLGSDYLSFRKALAEFRGKADTFRSDDEIFDAQMAIGRTLTDHRWYGEALTSFRRATELKPGDARAHFCAGNAWYSTAKLSEAQASYEKALETGQTTSPNYHSLLPQVHVNLGIVLEGEGMLLGACEHYREAAILNPAHYRALKHYGSALLGVGEYLAAEKALEEAIYLKPDFADAHCDLGSALHALGEHEKAITEFQRAIDLKPDHLDALYNLGGLLRESGKYDYAAEMYSKVLTCRPRDWRAQLNKAVSLLGSGDSDGARKALREALKMTNRVEVYDAMKYLKQMQKKPKSLTTPVQSAQDSSLREGNTGNSSSGRFLVIDQDKFQRANDKTTPRIWLGNALAIRHFQKQSRLYKMDSSLLNAEMERRSREGSEPSSSSLILVRKAEFEKLLKSLLHPLNPESFQAAVKIINEKLLAVLGRGSSGGRVDLGMFLAVIAVLCSSLSTDKRKKLVFQVLAWRNPRTEGTIANLDAKNYLKLMRAVYFPLQGISDICEQHGDEDRTANISYPEFLVMFDDEDWGFGILNTLVKLEVGDRHRHNVACAVCLYPIAGRRFKEVNSNFSLCSLCYTEGKVPTTNKQDEYNFKEIGSEMESKKRWSLRRTKES